MTFQFNAQEMARASQKKQDAALSAHRRRVTDNSLPFDQPRIDLSGQVPLEAALYAASGHDFGDGEFYYSVSDGREDLNKLLKGKQNLGPIMTSGRLGIKKSVLAHALDAQDGESAKALVQAGARMAEDENPVQRLFKGASNNAHHYNTDNDPTGIEVGLDAIEKAGYDLNAPIMDKPAAFYISSHLVTQSLWAEQLYGKGDDTNIAQIVRISAEKGIDFGARDRTGGVIEHIEKRLEGDTLSFDKDHPLRKVFADAEEISRDFRISEAARRKTEAKAPTCVNKTSSLER